MSDPLVFFDSSEIAEGKVEEVKAAFKELADFVRENEPRVISYNVFYSQDDRLVTIVQVHPDSASMENHMEVAAHLFRRMTGLLTMRSMDVYGRPSDRLLEQMREKARMLGASGVGVHDLGAGFTR